MWFPSLIVVPWLVPSNPAGRHALQVKAQLRSLSRACAQSKWNSTKLAFKLKTCGVAGPRFPIGGQSSAICAKILSSSPLA